MANGEDQYPWRHRSAVQGRACLPASPRYFQSMGKYDPLHKYLRRRAGSEVRLSFRDIERIIGALLPNSAARAQWWANEQQPETRHVQSIAWRDAGYEAQLVEEEEVVFRRRRVS